MFNLENDRPNAEVEGTGVSGLILLVISIFSSKNRRIFSSSSNCKWKFTFVRFKSMVKNIAFNKFYSTYPGISFILPCDFKQQVTNHQINLRNMQMPLCIQMCCTFIPYTYHCWGVWADSGCSATIWINILSSFIAGGNFILNFENKMIVYISQQL